MCELAVAEGVLIIITIGLGDMEYYKHLLISLDWPVSPSYWSAKRSCEGSNEGNPFWTDDESFMVTQTLETMRRRLITQRRCTMEGARFLQLENGGVSSM